MAALLLGCPGGEGPPPEPGPPGPAKDGPSERPRPTALSEEDALAALTHKNLGGEEYQHNHALRHFTLAPKGEVPIHNHKCTQIM